MTPLQKIIAFFKSFFRSPYFTGVLEDDRFDAEKQRDFLHEERALAAIIEDPFGNKQIVDTPYIYFNQYDTFSCVPHGVGLALSGERQSDTGVWQAIAPIFDYRFRSNYPVEGSSLQNIADIYKNRGTPLYTTLPTPQNETLANAVTITDYMLTEAKIFQGKKYISFMFPNNIIELAKVAQLGHGVAILIYANEEEYAREYPLVAYPNLNKYGAAIRHCVCILPKSGFIKDGVKYVTIQDSSWFGGWKIRHLSEEFITKRCYGALYWDTVNVIGSGPRPKWTFTMPVSYGMSNGEVGKVQELLISEGLLATGSNTGFFGGMTLAGVNAFQSRYASEILAPQGLLQPTGRWGNGCITKANQLCTP